jgi:hypothetical protein
MLYYVRGIPTIIIINKQTNKMSQFFFDYFVNKIGEVANELINVVPDNKVTNEEINYWED